MRVVIYNKRIINEQAIHYSLEPGKPTKIINDVDYLRECLEESPDEDVEGIITPDANQNPEFQAILAAIYTHKLRLYQKTTTDYQSEPLIHYIFLKTMEKHFGKNILQQAN